jgi:hypothetical protein
MLERGITRVLLLPDNISMRVPGKLYTQCIHRK